jgi:hypothetical protein
LRETNLSLKAISKDKEITTREHFHYSQSFFTGQASSYPFARIKKPGDNPLPVPAQRLK